VKRPAISLLTAVVVIAMVTALWRYLAVDTYRGELVLTEVVGSVTLERPEVDPVAASPGTVLGAEDRIATGAGGRAVLSMGAETRARLGPTSSVQVIAVDETGISLELEDGALHATVRPGSGAVRVANRGRAVLATSGSFQVGVAGEVMQVNALSGDVSLVGVDRTRLDAGQQATLVDRRAEVGEVPESLLLAVEWPAQAARTRRRSDVLRGRTAPGAQVVIRGSFGERTIRADTLGHFEAEVPLGEGGNPVGIEAVDAFGARAADSGALHIRDTHGPSFQAGVEYGE